MSKKILAVFVGLVLPSIVFAVSFTPIIHLVEGISVVVKAIVPILIGIAMIVFFWGLVRYVYKTGSKGTVQSKQIMFTGLMVLFVMISVWGIIELARTLLGVGNESSITPPRVNTD